MDLKKLLSSLGMTQKELSELSGVNLRQINRVATGEAPLGNMTGRNLLAISSALGVSMEELLGEGEPEVAPLRPQDIFTKEALAVLTPEELRQQIKVEQASDWSGWRRYPTTCGRLLERIPSEWWGLYSARHIGEVMRLLERAYSNGKSER